MRYLVISDVHSNLEALEAVFARAPSEQILCLGDMVGYGPNPNECVSALRARDGHTILGNHDVAVIDDFGLADFNERARVAIAFTQARLHETHRDWLNKLAYEVRMPDFLLVHGAPVNYFAYTMDKRSAATAFAATDARIIFLGHTHVAETYVLRADGSIEHVHFQSRGRLTLEAGSRYIVNPGSVGQPRDLNPQAAFALYDEASETIEFSRVPYRIDVVQLKMQEAGLPAWLCERIALGR